MTFDINARMSVDSNTARKDAKAQRQVRSQASPERSNLKQEANSSSSAKTPESTPSPEKEIEREALSRLFTAFFSTNISPEQFVKIEVPPSLRAYQIRLAKIDRISELSAETEDASDEASRKAVQEVLNDTPIATHYKGPKDRAGDLDAKSSVWLFKDIANFPLGDTQFLGQGEKLEVAGVTCDTGDIDGISLEMKDGKLLVVIDHHDENKSVRGTSATKFVYEMLNGMGFFNHLSEGDQKALKKTIDFINSADNKLSYAKEQKGEVLPPVNERFQIPYDKTNEQVYNESDRTIFGLQRFVDPTKLFEFMKNDGDVFKVLNHYELQRYGLIETGDEVTNDDIRKQLAAYNKSLHVNKQVKFTPEDIVNNRGSSDLWLYEELKLFRGLRNKLKLYHVVVDHPREQRDAIKCSLKELKGDERYDGSYSEESPMKQDGYIVESSEYGKIVIDPGKISSKKSKMYPRIQGMGDAAHAINAGVYIYFPENDAQGKSGKGFFIASAIKGLPEGFRLGQGKKARTMWITTHEERAKDRTVTLREILTKLGVNLETLTGKLKAYIDSETTSTTPAPASTTPAPASTTPATPTPSTTPAPATPTPSTPSTPATPTPPEAQTEQVKTLDGIIDEKITEINTLIDKITDDLIEDSEDLKIHYRDSLSLIQAKLHTEDTEKTKVLEELQILREIIQEQITDWTNQKNKKDRLKLALERSEQKEAEIQKELGEAKSEFENAKAIFHQAYKDHVNTRKTREALGFQVRLDETESTKNALATYRKAKVKYIQLRYKLESQEMMSKYNRGRNSENDGNESEGEGKNKLAKLNEEYKQKLTKLKSETIFSGIELAEQEELQKIKIDLLNEPSKNPFKKTLALYMRQSSGVKIGISTAVVTAAYSALGIVSGMAIGYFAGMRIIRAMVGAKVSAAVGAAAHLAGETYLSDAELKEKQKLAQSFNWKNIEQMEKQWNTSLNNLQTKRNIKIIGVGGAALLAGIAAGSLAGTVLDPSSTSEATQGTQESPPSQGASPSSQYTQYTQYFPNLKDDVQASVAANAGLFHQTMLAINSGQTQTPQVSIDSFRAEMEKLGGINPENGEIVTQQCIARMLTVEAQPHYNRISAAMEANPKLDLTSMARELTDQSILTDSLNANGLAFQELLNGVDSQQIRKSIQQQINAIAASQPRVLTSPYLYNLIGQELDKNTTSQYYNTPPAQRVSTALVAVMGHIRSAEMDFANSLLETNTTLSHGETSPQPLGSLTLSHNGVTTTTRESLRFQTPNPKQGLYNTAKKFGLSDGDFKAAWGNAYKSVPGKNLIPIRISDMGLVHTDTKLAYFPGNEKDGPAFIVIEGTNKIGTDRDLLASFENQGISPPKWLVEKLSLTTESTSPGPSISSTEAPETPAPTAEQANILKRAGINPDNLRTNGLLNQDGALAAFYLAHKNEFPSPETFKTFSHELATDRPVLFAQQLKFLDDNPGILHYPEEVTTLLSASRDLQSTGFSLDKIDHYLGFFENVKDPQVRVAFAHLIQGSLEKPLSIRVFGVTPDNVVFNPDKQEITISYNNTARNELRINTLTGDHSVREPRARGATFGWTKQMTWGAPSDGIGLVEKINELRKK